MNKLSAYIILLFIVFGCNNDEIRNLISKIFLRNNLVGTLDIIEHSGISFENKDYTEI